MVQPRKFSIISTPDHEGARMRARAGGATPAPRLMAGVQKYNGAQVLGVRAASQAKGRNR
jgi:hypothetical protein